MHSRTYNNGLENGWNLRKLQFCFTFLFQAAEHFRQGDIQQGKRYRINAIVAMVITVIVGIIFAITFSVVRIKR